ncbi:hypothetical protein [Paramaledivibacter caminithermalis]|jgi:hypothetical protein|uniref:Uncharacterized protein n=1 Tax=Paramaledivibacter caminithermalis (strain DSM 15212 / CIP 107654 / DViRD3) TaxID=1121301 RepID=A0A1M6T9N2_PARC5|nr:hypothetical protein [Paramaledivibacter caminithermalis]SHK53683.1 hypothetical protein SAMN02745912_03612 [Paramaledivibacter caminithermalis DSM 15212]
MFDFIFKTLLFALTIAFLGSWGMIKQQRKKQELVSKLYRNVESIIIKELQNKKELSIMEIEEIVKGTKASLFWSKDKIKVIDSKLVCRKLLKNMVAKGLITEQMRKNKKYFILK